MSYDDDEEEYWYGRIAALEAERDEALAVIEKIRSHSRPVRYVVEWAEGKRDDNGAEVA